MSVEALFAGDEHTPNQCLIEATKSADEMKCVVVAYLIMDTGGETRLRMSNCDSRDLLWLGNAFKVFALDG
jgi:hypothetical protein